MISSDVLFGFISSSLHTSRYIVKLIDLLCPLLFNKILLIVNSIFDKKIPGEERSCYRIRASLLFHRLLLPIAVENENQARANYPLKAGFTRDGMRGPRGVNGRPADCT